MPGMLSGVLDNELEPRDKISLNELVMTKCKARGLSMMLKTGMEVAQDYTVLNCGHPRPHKYLKSQGIKIMAQPRMNPEPIVFTGHRKEKTEKDPPPRRVDRG